MAASRHTYTAIRGGLRDLADAGTLTVKSAALAESTGITNETIQRYGRQNPTLTIEGQWTVTYGRGKFTITQRKDYREPEHVVAPDWFELPTGIVPRDRHSGFDVGQRRMLTYQFVQACLDGVIALAPWQRKAVWTEAQQVAMLDSMMHGISIGALTMWHRPRSESLEGARPLPGCKDPEHGYLSSQLIVDGQQRATTLVLAALGRLDHWRWNGHEWTTGNGFLLPSRAIVGAMDASCLDWARLLLDHPDHDQGRLAINEHAEQIARTDLDLMVLGGTSAEMIETYRRLATHGSPHSPEDLALMERWRRENLDPLTKAYEDLDVPRLL